MRIQLVKGEVLHQGLQWSFDVIADLLIMWLQSLGVEKLLKLKRLKLERVPDGLVQRLSVKHDGLEWLFWSLLVLDHHRLVLRHKTLTDSSTKPIMIQVCLRGRREIIQLLLQVSSIRSNISKIILISNVIVSASRKQRVASIRGFRVVSRRIKT